MHIHSNIVEMPIEICTKVSKFLVGLAKVVRAIIDKILAEILAKARWGYEYLQELTFPPITLAPLFRSKSELLKAFSISTSITLKRHNIIASSVAAEYRPTLLFKSQDRANLPLALMVRM